MTFHIPFRAGRFAAALLVAVAGSSPTVGYASPGIDAGQDVAALVEQRGAAFWDSQQALGRLKTWIITQPEVSGSGYVDQVNDAGTRSVRLLWNGSDPFLEKVLQQASSLGIQASVETRSMSLAEIKVAAQAGSGQCGTAGFGWLSRPVGRRGQRRLRRP